MVLTTPYGTRAITMVLTRVGYNQALLDKPVGGRGTSSFFVWLPVHDTCQFCLHSTWAMWTPFPTDQRVIPVGRGGRAAGGGQPVGKSEFPRRRVAVFVPCRALCGSALMAEAVRGDGTSGLFRRAAISQPIWATQSSFIGQTADHTVVSSLTGDFVPMQALHHRHRHGTDYL